MKSLTHIAVVAAIALLSARCDPPVVFTEAQPVGEEARPSFEDSYQGTWFCEEDSAWVKVSPTLMYKKKTWSLLFTRAELDSMEEVKLEGNRLYIEPLDQYVDLKYQNDSLLYGDFIIRDTMFNLELEGQVIKYYRGHEILNFKKSDDNWEIWILSLDAVKNLSVARAEIPGDLEKLEAMTRVTQIGPTDNPRYQLSPSKTEFRKLIHSDVLFKECEFYIRVAGEVNL